MAYTKPKESAIPDADPDVLDVNPITQATQPAADLEKLKKYFTESAYKTKEARENSLVCVDYYDSDQYTGAELEKLAKRSQPPIVINRIKPAINGIIGVTERGRSEPKALPRNPGTEEQADAATDVLRYIADFNRFKRLKTDCFWDLLVPGTMAALIGVDQDRQVTIEQIRWEEFFYDPQSRRRDYKDARYMGVAKWMYADDLGAMYRDKADSIQATADAGTGMAITDESFMDRPLVYSGLSGWVDIKQRRLMVVEMYYREGGWKRCVFTGSDVLEESDSPYLDHKGRPECPIEAMSAYVKRNNARYGAVWDMLGPQDEVNKRRSSALHRMVAKQVQVKDPTALQHDVDTAREEASKPDGVLPPGYEFADNRADVAGQLELLQEAKAEIERMGPNPAVLGRDGQDASGRALLARQQSGLIELSTMYGALEDWELRVYRQCWGRVKQYWTAPQFIRVTDDEDAPRFVGLNQPVVGGPPSVVQDPQTGLATVKPNILGYKNRVAEMDVDIEIDAQPDMGTVQQEAFNELMKLVAMSPVYQQQVPLATLVQLSPIPHKRSLLDVLKQNAAQQQAQQAQQQALAAQHLQAKTHEAQAGALENAASGQAKMINALTYNHEVHADHAAAGFEAGVNQAQSEQQAQAQAQQAAQQQAQGQPGVQGQPQPSSAGSPQGQ